MAKLALLICFLTRHRVDWDQIDRNGCKCRRCGKYLRGDQYSREMVRRWKAPNPLPEGKE